MKEYQFFIRHPFFKHNHIIEALNVEDATEIIRNRYNVTDEKQRRLYIITSAFEDGNKVITEQKLFNK